MRRPLAIRFGLSAIVIVGGALVVGVLPTNKGAPEAAVQPTRPSVHETGSTFPYTILDTATDERQQLKPKSGTMGLMTQAHDELMIRVFAVGPEGAGVSGAEVAAFLPPGRKREMLETADDLGFVEFHSADVAGWAIEARSEGMFGSRYGVAPGQEVTVRMEPSRALRIQVEDQFAIPVEDAMVRIIQGKKYVAWSGLDAQGLSAEIHIPEGEVTAMISGRSTAQKMEPGVAGEVAPLWPIIVQRLPYSLVGRIVDCDNVPIQGAVIQDRRHREHVSKSDEDGIFSLGRYPDRAVAVLLTTHDEFVFTVTEVRFDGADENVQIPLQNGLELAVSVVDEAGRPIAGAKADVFCRTGYATDLSSPPVDIEVRKSLLTDESGSCVILGLVSGALDLTVSHGDYSRGWIQARPGGEAVVTLRERHDWQWLLKLEDSPAELVGLEGWSLTLTADDGDEGMSGNLRRSWRGDTDRTGRLELTQIPEGTYHAIISSSNGRWTEDAIMDVSGSGASYEGPTIILQADANTGFGVGHSIHGEGFVGTFFVANEALVCLSRPGHVSLNWGGDRVELSIPDIGSGTHMLGDYLVGNERMGTEK